jgi:hypothetical protein
VWKNFGSLTITPMWNWLNLNEPYLTDIQLEVKGIKMLYDSFWNYVAIEMLDGKNKYEAKGFGLQDTHKGIIFQSFPPVLCLQLGHSGYNTQLNGIARVCITHVLNDTLVPF